MSYWNNVKTDLKIDSNYGDFEIVGNDIYMTRSSKEILKHTVIERFKTNLNDFNLNPNYGASLEDFIGRGIDERLAEDVVTRFRYSLTYDNFLSNNELEILSVVMGNTIKIHTYISTLAEEIQIIVTYDREGINFD